MTAARLDPSALGTTVGPTTRRWDERDTLLYALGVGGGTEDLAFTTENTGGVKQRVLPTFGVVLCHDRAIFKAVGGLDLRKLVHGAQSIRLVRPLPAAGELSVVGEVTSIVDKGAGKHAILQACFRGTDPDTGELVVETESTLVIRDGGGFGGDPGKPAERVTMPEQAPDFEVRTAVRPDQALLYRLSGDRNRLHSDPGFAKQAGFPGPILHGLCTFGMAGRVLLRELCDDDPARFETMSARFSAPVFPGQTLLTRGWVVSDDSAVFTTEADGGTVLSAGRCTFRA
jgi:acyl dehydratase